MEVLGGEGPRGGAGAAGGRCGAGGRRGGPRGVRGVGRGPARTAAAACERDVVDLRDGQLGDGVARVEPERRGRGDHLQREQGAQPLAGVVDPDDEVVDEPVGHGVDVGGAGQVGPGAQRLEDEHDDAGVLEGGVGDGAQQRPRVLGAGRPSAAADDRACADPEVATMSSTQVATWARTPS